MNTIVPYVQWHKLLSVIDSATWAEDVSIYQSSEYLSITGRERKFHAHNLWNLKNVKEYNIVLARQNLRTIILNISICRVEMSLIK